MKHALLTLTLLGLAAGQAKDKEALRVALKDTDLAAGWIYDDLAAGFAQAKSTGKPLLVAFR